MISLDLMKPSEGSRAGDQPRCNKKWYSKASGIIKEKHDKYNQEWMSTTYFIISSYTNLEKQGKELWKKLFTFPIFYLPNKKYCPQSTFSFSEDLSLPYFSNYSDASSDKFGYSIHNTCLM